MIKPEEVEILDEELNLDTYETARSEDIFDKWKAEEYNEENHSSEGVYLGDGVYR